MESLSKQQNARTNTKTTPNRDTLEKERAQAGRRPTMPKANSDAPRVGKQPVKRKEQLAKPPAPIILLPAPARLLYKKEKKVKKKKKDRQGPQGAKGPRRQTTSAAAKTEHAKIKNLKKQHEADRTRSRAARRETELNTGNPAPTTGNKNPPALKQNVIPKQMYAP